MFSLKSFRKRLREYHSVWEQVLFGLSLLGVFTVVHLFIQQGRNFDRGCFGFEALDTEQMAFDCSAVVSSGSGTFLGVSNIVWGVGFYLGIALLTFAIFWGGRRWRAWMQGGRLGLLTGGVLYSSYLVYMQVAVINALCALCLASAGITGLLFAVQAILLATDLQSSETTMTDRLFKRDLTVYVYSVAFVAILIGADLTYFNALTPAAEEAATAHKEQYSGAACQLNAEKGSVSDPSSLVSFQDVTMGPSDASVTIVEYFDPNCPHCKTFHEETMKTLISEYSDQVRFVFKPFPLRGSSLPEVQALYAAHQEGKFSEMLNAQYARQSRTGITEQDLRAIASEIGMNPDVLMSRVNQNKYREQILKQRKRAISIGVDSTPTVLVNGHFAGSRSLECMKMFIQRAQEGTLGEGA